MNDITIKTLENTSISKILDCFNKSFSDYEVPVQLVRAQLENKILSENILMHYSIGAFFDDNLIGFILHGYDIMKDKQVLYNAGTGVIPEYRGNGITEKMYSFGLPRFKKEGIELIVLEALTDNNRAIKVYKRIGFEVLRTVGCYKGEISLFHSLKKPERCSIKKVESYNWNVLKTFWNYEPTWQNSIATIERNIENLEIWGAFENDVIVGYLIYAPDRKRIQLLAVKPDYRRKGFASLLITHLQSIYGGEFSVVNLDARDSVTHNFLHYSIGLKEYVKQYEMCLTI